MTSGIRTVVFPVAGLGTRFLPATKAVPKEMLAVVDKPLIQYAVEEAVAAGAEKLVFVTGRTKNAIENHFDMAFELETELAARGKDDLLAQVEAIVPEHVSCLYVRQRKALGLGHAVLCARALVDDDYFGVILADDLIHNPASPALGQLAAVAAEREASVVSVQEVSREKTRHYGVVDTGGAEGPVQPVRGLVEKPDPADAPSNLAVVGRYVLSSRIFELLAETPPDHRGEIQLTDAMAALLEHQSMVTCRFEGKHFDAGNKLGFLQATVELGLEHAEIGPDFAAWLAQRKPAMES